MNMNRRNFLNKTKYLLLFPSLIPLISKYAKNKPTQVTALMLPGEFVISKSLRQEANNTGKVLSSVNINFKENCSQV